MKIYHRQVVRTQDRPDFHQACRINAAASTKRFVKADYCQIIVRSVERMRNGTTVICVKHK